jgi:hypothetical protein
MIGRGVWPHFGWSFTSWSVLVAPNRQLTGGRFHRGGSPMATIVGVAAPEKNGKAGGVSPRRSVTPSNDEAPALGEVKWPGQHAQAWRGRLTRVDSQGNVIAEEPTWRRYASPYQWYAPAFSAAFSAEGDAWALEGAVAGRSLCGFSRRFGWMMESEAVVGDDTIVESMEVFDETEGHLVVLQRWYVDQTLQRAEVMRLRPEAES